MTQDQYGQAQDSGYVRGQVVEDDDTGEFSDDQDKPMTRFQKVASALRGDRPDRDDPDQVDPSSPQTVDPDGTVDSNGTVDPNGMAPEAHDGPPYPASGAGGSQRGDYWDSPDTRVAGQDQTATVTSPDIPVTDGVGADPSLTADRDTATGQDTGYAQRTQPDTFADRTASGDGTTVPVGNGAATVADAPITQTPEDAAVTDAPGSPAGRHAAAYTPEAQETQELHPGEATGTLDDLGDLAYGNLIPDAAQFTDQWKEIQFKFVDDPRASVTEAAEVVSQVTAKMAAAMQERQRAIEARQKAIADQQSSLRGRWGDDAEADTETLRETLRMYRAFLDQLIGPKA